MDNILRWVMKAKVAEIITKKNRKLKAWRAQHMTGTAFEISRRDMENNKHK